MLHSPEMTQDQGEGRARERKSRPKDRVKTAELITYATGNGGVDEAEEDETDDPPGEDGLNDPTVSTSRPAERTTISDKGKGGTRGRKIGDMRTGFFPRRYRRPTLSDEEGVLVSLVRSKAAETTGEKEDEQAKTRVAQAGRTIFRQKAHSLRLHHLS
jgi:hypothetical protein